jgi:anti-anti-sigma factor
MAGRPGGDHVCWTYASDAERREVLVEFLGEGLAAAEKVVCLVRRGTEPDVADIVAAAGYDARDLLAGGRLVVAAAEDAYLQDGTFDPAACIRSYEAFVREAVAEGFTGIRVFGEVGWLLRLPEAREAWASYEFQAGALAARLPVVALCGYDERECDQAALELVAAIHTSTLSADSRRQPPPFHVRAGADGSVVLDGEVDYFSADDVRALILGSADETGEVVIDVSHLRFVDVAGMSAIVAATRDVRGRHGVAEVRGASPMFRRMWSHLGYDRLHHVELAS